MLQKLIKQQVTIFFYVFNLETASTKSSSLILQPSGELELTIPWESSVSRLTGFFFFFFLSTLVLVFENLPPPQLFLSLDEEVKESQSLRHVKYVSSCTSTLVLPTLVSCGLGCWAPHEL